MNTFRGFFAFACQTAELYCRVISKLEMLGPQSCPPVAHPYWCQRCVDSDVRIPLCSVERASFNYQGHWGTEPNHWKSSCIQASVRRATGALEENTHPLFAPASATGFRQGEAVKSRTLSIPPGFCKHVSHPSFFMVKARNLRRT